MPKFVIERTVPGAGLLSAAELRAISGKSNQVLADMNGRATWQQSYVTDGKDLLRLHRRGRGRRPRARRAGRLPGRRRQPRLTGSTLDGE